MQKMDPLGKILADSLASNDPKINGGTFYASWRAIALALLEYRRSDFTNAIHWLDQCSTYPGQASSCVATTHILQGMALSRLGKDQEAAAELKIGKQMVSETFQKFQKKLEWGDNRSGVLPGWLMARIFLREAETHAANPPETSP